MGRAKRKPIEEEFSMATKRLEIVEWVDAESDVEWSTPADIDKWKERKVIVTEIGWNVAENDDHLILVSQFTSDSILGNRTKINKTRIISRKGIELKEKRK